MSPTLPPVLLEAFFDELEKQAKVPGFAFKGLMRDAPRVGAALGVPQVTSAVKDVGGMAQAGAKLPATGFWDKARNTLRGVGHDINNFAARAQSTPIGQFAGQLGQAG